MRKERVEMNCPFHYTELQISLVHCRISQVTAFFKRCEEPMALRLARAGGPGPPEDPPHLSE